MKHGIIILCTFLGAQLCIGQSMNNTKLERIIESVSDSVEGTTGSWQFMYNERLMLLITDENYNRMRLIMPVHMADQLSTSELTEALTANFHSALDVKYAISNGVMWSAFIHPLSALSEEQFRDALSQVYRAAETFGTTYSSTDLVFPGHAPEPKTNKKPRKKM